MSEHNHRTRARLAQRRAVASEPGARLLIVRAGLGNQPPIGARVVHTPQVHQFVHEDVVTNALRHQHQPPVQRDVCVAPAGPPSCSLIANGDPAHGEPVLLRELT